MDWGLMRAYPGSYRFLRDRINFHPAFYYWCIVTDLILRFWWIVSLFTITAGKEGQLFHDLKILAGINIMLEAFRRA